jgi:hypothetical protein
MSREHDFAIYDEPVWCRNCGRLQESVRADDEPKPCAGVDRRKLVDVEADGSIARRMAEIRAKEGRA